jgi:hypothetical protein
MMEAGDALEGEGREEEENLNKVLKNFWALLFFRNIINLMYKRK